MRQLIKSICFVLFTLCSAFLLDAQAYHIQDVRNRVLNLNGNPRALNLQADDANETDGWKRLPWDTLNKGYTLPDTLPFDFKLNGNTEKVFRASKNGMMTFNAGTLPGVNYSIDRINDSRLPEKSIVVGGILAKSDNDRILVKVFGQAPNRQYYIKFHSFCVSADTNQTLRMYSYTAIVLEEQSNQIHIVQMASGSEGNFSNAGLPKILHSAGIYLGASEYYSLADIGGQYDYDQSKSKACSDNEYCTFATGNYLPIDASLRPQSSAAPNGLYYHKAGTDFYFQADFSRHGSVLNPHLFDIYIQVNNQLPQKDSIPSGLTNCDYRRSALAFKVKHNFLAGERLTIKAWIKQRNGLPDGDLSNDTLDSPQDVIVQNQSTTEMANPMFEYYTATWCNACPRAHELIDSLLKKSEYKNVIAIAQHQNDNMSNQWLPNVSDSLPIASINRNFASMDSFIVPKNFDSRIKASLKFIPKRIDIQIDNIVFNEKRRTITGQVLLTAREYLAKEQLRVGVMLKEVDVRGIGSGWDQFVDHALTKDSQSIYFGKSKILTGYHHQNVFWTADGGTFGYKPFTLPSVMEPGQTTTWNFSVAIPDTIVSITIPLSADYGPKGSGYVRYKPADFGIVAYVSDDVMLGLSETRNRGIFTSMVLNATEKKVWDVSANTRNISQKQGLYLFPNPSKNAVQVVAKAPILFIRVMDAMGRVVLSPQGGGMSEMNLDVSTLVSGWYIVQAYTYLGISSNRLMVQQ